jgi:hypothetical protein
MEQILRKILDKRVDLLESGSKKDTKYFSIRSLFRAFIKEYPEKKPLEEPFNFVIRICNAAIHGQRIPEAEAREALNLAAEIIAVLEDIPASNEKNAKTQ